MAVSDSPFVGLGTLKLRRGMRAALRECTRSTKPHGSDDEGDRQHFQTVRNIHSLTSSFDFRRALSKRKANRRRFMSLIGNHGSGFTSQKFVVQSLGYEEPQKLSELNEIDSRLMLRLLLVTSI